MISFFKHLGLVAFALLPLVSSAALQSGKVQVGKVTGTATLIDAKSQRKPLESGAVFQEGSRVETDVDSTAELVFSNGASLVLTPSTLLELRTFRQVPSAGITDPYRQIEKDPSPSVTEVEVPRGKVIGEVRKLNALSTFSVKTPAGLVRIRGTVFTVEYRVGADGIGKIVVSCVRGSVETTVYSANVGPVAVDPGMQTSSSVPSAALINSVARSAGAAPAGAAAALRPSRCLSFRTPPGTPPSSSPSSPPLPRCRPKSPRPSTPWRRPLRPVRPSSRTARPSRRSPSARSSPTAPTPNRSLLRARSAPRALPFPTAMAAAAPRWTTT